MFSIKRFLILAIILQVNFFGALTVRNFVLAGSPSPQMKGEGIMEITSENLEQFLDSYLPSQMEIAHVPGLVITIVQGDEILLSKGYGYADLEKSIPMTAETNIRAGSVSKSVLATAVIKLVGQGVLSLDAPVSDYLPDLELEDEMGQASTVGQLLNHMSGYPDNLVLSHSPDIKSGETLEEVLRADLPERAFAPGLVSAYSDWNFTLLGYAIESAMDQPYETVVDTLLFTPSGMKHSTYTQPLPQDMMANLAVGYGWNYAKQRYDVVPHDFARLSPGIALVTNGVDMGLYLTALLNAGMVLGERVLDLESLDLLLKRQTAAHPFSRGWSYGFVENTIASRKVMYKDGNGIGFSSRIILISEMQLGLFVSTNHRNLGEGLWLTQAASIATRTLVSAILENFTPESAVNVPEVKPMPVQAERNQLFTGHYQKAAISRNDFFKLEGLLDNVDVKDNGDGILRIGSGLYWEVEPLVFQNIDNPSFFIVFVENPQGEVEFLTFGGTGSYQKVRWYQAKNTQIVLALATTLISLSMVVVWSITHHTHWAALILGLLNLGFLVGVGLMFIPAVTDMLDFFKMIPMGVRVLFALPWCIGILSLLILYLVIAAWNDADAVVWRCIHQLLLIGASAVLVWMAQFWNLMLK